MEKLESLAKQGTIARGKYGVPYSVRSTALMPLWLVDHAGTKAVLPPKSRESAQKRCAATCSVVQVRCLPRVRRHWPQRIRGETGRVTMHGGRLSTSLSRRMLSVQRSCCWQGAESCGRRIT